MRYIGKGDGNGRKGSYADGVSAVRSDRDGLPAGGRAGVPAGAYGLLPGGKDGGGAGGSPAENRISAGSAGENGTGAAR